MDAKKETDDLAERRWQQIRREIAIIVDQERPDRYVVRDADVGVDGDDTGVEWMDRVAERVAGDIPETKLRVRYAREVVGRIETTALRRGNKYLRKLVESDQLELYGVAQLSYPISVVQRELVKEERPKIRITRVKLLALNTIDLYEFAKEERRTAAKDFAVRNATCEAAEQIAEEMSQYGDATLGDWVKRKSGRSAG